MSSNNTNTTETGHTTNTIDTHGRIISSDDPTTQKGAKPTEKITGDIKGAVSGTIGSMEAATGAAIRNKRLEEKGFEKMSEEDHRLGAKKGVPPIGSETRNTTVTEGDARP